MPQGLFQWSREKSTQQADLIACFSSVAAFHAFIAWHQCDFISIFFTEWEEDAALHQLADGRLLADSFGQRISQGVSQ